MRYLDFVSHLIMHVQALELLNEELELENEKLHAQLKQYSDLVSDTVNRSIARDIRLINTLVRQPQAAEHLVGLAEAMIASQIDDDV